MLRSFRPLLLSLGLSLLATACASSGDVVDPTDPGGTLPGPTPTCVAANDAFDHVDIDETRPVPPIENGNGPTGGHFLTGATAASDDEAEPSACACATNECVVEWIEQNVGCDVCAHVVCDAGMVGACVACPATAEAGAPDSVDHAHPGTCMLAPDDLELARE